MSEADYAGRTVDVCLFSNLTDTPGATPLIQSVFASTAVQVCTGIDKLLQRVVILFCTPRGTVPSDPLRGTTFITHALQGGFRTEAEARVIFGFDAIELMDYLAKRTPSTAPDDEILDTLELLEIVLSPGEVSLTLRITSLAGDSRTKLLPLNALPFSLV